MQKQWKQYRFEIVALFLALVGLFLLVEPFQIRETFWRLFAQTIRVGTEVGVAAVDGVVAFTARQTLSDLTGMALVLVAFVVLAARVRWHLLHAQHWTRRLCPQCGGAIVRIPRSRLDRIVGRLFKLPLSRHLCRHCGWSGRRYGHAHRYTNVAPLFSDVQWDEFNQEQDAPSASSSDDL